MVYTTGATGGISLQESATGSITGLNIYGTYLTQNTATTSANLGTVSADYATAVGSNSGLLPATANLALNIGASNFTIDQAINTGTLVLNSTGTVTQTAAITTSGGLDLLGSGGAYALTNSGNTVGTLAGDTGTVNYSDRSSLAVGTVAGTSGLTGSGAITLTSGGSLTINAGAAVTSTGGSILLVANGTFTNNAGANAVSAGTGDDFTIYSQNSTNVTGVLPADTFDGVTGTDWYNDAYNFTTNSFASSLPAGENLFVYGYAASATVTANNQTQTYGAGNTFTAGYKTSGLAAGNTIGSVNFATDATMSSSSNWNAGTWTITPSAGSGSTFNPNNYNVSYASGTLTVNQLALTASIAAGSTPYGSAIAPGAVTFSNQVTGDVVNAGTVTLVNPTYSTGGAVNAGSYAQQVGGTLSGADAGNYTFAGFTTATPNYTVSKLALTASIAAGSTQYGAAIAPGAVTFSNQVSGDVVNAGTVTLVNPTYSTGGAVNAGSYAQQVGGTLSKGGCGQLHVCGLHHGDAELHGEQACADGIDYPGGSTPYGAAIAPGAVTFSNQVTVDAVNAGTVTLVNPTYGSGGAVNANRLRAAVGSPLSGADAGNYTLRASPRRRRTTTVSKLALKRHRLRRGARSTGRRSRLGR